MKRVEGKYSTAKIFTDNVDDASIAQVKTLCDMPYAKDSHIRMMPDIHAGAGCTIGTTMQVKDKICPNLVGVDVACRMLVVQLEDKRIDLPKLDSMIKNNIPSGFSIREKTHKFARDSRIDELKFPFEYVKAQRAIGSLGGGNHFIAIEQENDGTNYLIIHTGSRNIGKLTAEYYQKKAYEITQSYDDPEIKNIPYELAFVEREMFDEYIEAMRILEDYSDLNRVAIADVIIDKMHLHEVSRFTTIHNYIDTDKMILRKGAIDASRGKICIIPMNMRDGSLICVGNGNADWNYSGPHGAGRVMSRSQARKSLTVSAFKKEMKGIYSTTIDDSTIDEAPEAYKDISSILENVVDSVDVSHQIKPIYNFKHSTYIRK